MSKQEYLYEKDGYAVMSSETAAQWRSACETALRMVRNDPVLKALVEEHDDGSYWPEWAEPQPDGSLMLCTELAPGSGIKVRLLLPPSEWEEREYA